jgi:hypothetical protein
VHPEDGYVSHQQLETVAKEKKRKKKTLQHFEHASVF